MYWVAVKAKATQTVPQIHISKEALKDGGATHLKLSEEE